jgi:hypothetical protein
VTVDFLAFAGLLQQHCSCAHVKQVEAVLGSIHDPQLSTIHGWLTGYHTPWIIVSTVCSVVMSHIGGSCWFCAGHKAPSGLLVVQGSQRCRVLEAASKCLGSCLLLVTGHSSKESLSQWVQLTNRWLHHERSARPASTYCKPALSTVYGKTPNNNCCTPTNRRQHNSFTPRQLV